MKERPLLFSAPMVQPLLDNRKTQTRRIAKLHPWTENGYWHLSHKSGITGVYHSEEACLNALIAEWCPYGKPGDLLWVRESFAAYGNWNQRWSEKKGRNEWYFTDETPARGFDYRFDITNLPSFSDSIYSQWFKRNSLFMSRGASRITLEITDVRVQRVQEISEDDAAAEGVKPGCFECGSMPHEDMCHGRRDTYVDSFARLWDSIHGNSAWVANPWVWRITFKRVQP